MVKKFHPTINKVYFVNQYTLFHILSGSGTIQVDFKNYGDWDGKAIYLEKGQFIKFLSDDFLVRKIEFPSEAIFRNKEVRVLFKHLISLGYINFSECSDCQKYLSNTIFSKQFVDIIDVSSKQWYWQNPFKASKSEYQIIFDIKEVIDQEFQNHLTNTELSALISESGHETQALVKNKIGITVKSLLANKRLLESKKEIAFTDKTIQEIAYDMGFKDPAYFNRVFKNQTSQTPADFRKNQGDQQKDTFAHDILELLKTYHTEERSIAFYADKLNLSVKTLSRKTQQKLNSSLGQLIRAQIINSAKELLAQGASIKETAFKLGFEEANHFSSFFKRYTQELPSNHKK